MPGIIGFFKRSNVGEPVKNVHIPSDMERAKETAENLGFTTDFDILTEKEFDAGLGLDTSDSSTTKPPEPNLTPGDKKTGAVWDGNRNPPHERIFGRTHEELDPELWNDRGLLKQNVANTVLSRLGQTMNNYDHSSNGAWKDWTRVYFAGSQASYWHGNRDFDILLGINYDLLKERNPAFKDMDTEEISKVITTQLRQHFNSNGWKPDWASEPYDLTGYVNNNSWDIRRIRPYAAYEIVEGKWYVEPPHLPHWSPSQFPQGTGLWKYLNGMVNAINGILEMPDPYKTQQAAAMWEFIHSNRSTAFGEGGHGWYDVPNVVEKYLDQIGLWQELYELRKKFKNEEYDKGDPWDNDPTKKTAASVDELLDLIGGNRVPPKKSSPESIYHEPRPRDFSKLPRGVKHHGDDVSHMGENVEWMPLNEVKRHREWDRSKPLSKDNPQGHWAYDSHEFDRHQKDVEENGIREPLVMHYDHESHRAKVAEGNHRLHWAEKAGMTHVPVKVVRGHVGHEEESRFNVRGENKMKHMNRLPEEMKPSQVFPDHYVKKASFIWTLEA